MNKDDKKAVMTKHQQHKKDTGSAHVQIAVLTARILSLTEHLKTHAKDKHSRRGLIGLVGRRRKLQKYMQMHQPAEYAKLVKELGLKK